MPEVPKPDDLLSRFAKIDDRLTAIEQRALKLWSIDTTGYDSTTSTSYVPLGPTLGSVQPGPGGQLLVGITAGLYGIYLGCEGFVSYRMDGPTMSVAESDDWAVRLENQGATGGYISAHMTRWSISPVLNPGIYNLTMMIRSSDGQDVAADGRGIIAMPI
jgi:hypothetical protein